MVKDCSVLFNIQAYGDMRRYHSLSIAHDHTFTDLLWLTAQNCYMVVCEMAKKSCVQLDEFNLRRTSAWWIIRRPVQVHGSHLFQYDGVFCLSANYILGIVLGKSMMTCHSPPSCMYRARRPYTWHERHAGRQVARGLTNYVVNRNANRNSTISFPFWAPVTISSRAGCSYGQCEGNVVTLQPMR